jgi:protein-disulfide isomerase
VPLLISTDGKMLAQFNKWDIGQDPREKVSSAGRPARGGPENAPVVIVGFDDLECPYCAELNAKLFPAILDRYKNQVRVVYRDFPLDQHPWAMHAAVDANCLATASATGYWDFVDYVHAHAAEMSSDDKALAKADQTLDKLVLDEGVRQKLNQPELTACVLKQDDSKVKASITDAEAAPLRVGSTPVLFINGEKVEGAQSMDTLYRIIDEALVAAGQNPPPPPPTPPAATAPAATKPGS